ncbi:MAG: ribosome maturation factor RimM [Anaerolineales bacterium]|nr:ribosome maturation factor RimM [Anaerolineales bacterium]
MAETKATSSGSPTGEPVYLVVGFLRRPHGVAGEIIMDVLTEFPERLKAGRKLFAGEKHQPITLTSSRAHANGLLVKLKGFNTPEEVGQFRNQRVYVKTADEPALPEGQYYHHQLIGLQVVDENDNPLGELTEVLVTGANDVYVVKDASGRELLLPAIPPVILDVELGRRLMRVHLLEGL